MDRRLGIAALGTLLSACAPSPLTAAPGPLPPAISHEALIERAPRRAEVQGSVYWGAVKEVKGPIVVIALRDGKSLSVDTTAAKAQGTVVVPTVGINLVVNGTMADGVLKARVVNRAKGPPTWGRDVP